MKRTSGKLLEKAARVRVIMPGHGASPSPNLTLIMPGHTVPPDIEVSPVRGNLQPVCPAAVDADGVVSVRCCALPESLCRIRVTIR